MKGKVNGQREAIVRLRIEGSRKKRITVAGIIDTGYDGMLTLPKKIIRSLKLPPVGQNEAELANGQVVSFDTYEAVVHWSGRKLRIGVDEAQTDPLIGMGLLDGFELMVQVKPRGKVTIAKLQ